LGGVVLGLLRALTLNLALIAGLVLIAVGALGTLSILTKYPDVLVDLLILSVSIAMVILGVYIISVVLEEV
jgi:hypothetical protein